MTKRCSKCIYDLPLSEFHKGRSKYGLYAYCKSCSSEIRKSRYLRTKDRHQAFNKQWIIDNYERHREYQNRYYREEKINFPVAYLARRLRDRTAINRNQKVGSAVKDLGYSIDKFKIYIENQFDKDMTWDNYGKIWELDHIIPLSAFDLTDKIELLKACNWLNIRPLLVRENRKKGGRLYDSSTT